MPVDPDNTQTFTQWVMGLFAAGGAGGAYKVITHETRISRLEDDRKLDIVKLDNNINAVSGIRGTLESVENTVNEIKDILMDQGLKK